MDEKSGHGFMEFSDGTIYIGDWKSNLMEG